MDLDDKAAKVFPEKSPQTPITSELTPFDHDIDSRDLPKGYYHSPLFIGTVIASGLSVMAVSDMCAFTPKEHRETESI